MWLSQIELPLPIDKWKRTEVWMFANIELPKIGSYPENTTSCMCIRVIGTFLVGVFYPSDATPTAACLIQTNQKMSTEQSFETSVKNSLKDHPVHLRTKIIFRKLDKSVKRADDFRLNSNCWSDISIHSPKMHRMGKPLRQRGNSLSP